MSKRLLSSLIGSVLMVLAGAAQAQCEDMVVIVRNSVYPINGLAAFCSEFKQMKTDLASMKSALSAARQENAMLKDQLTVGALQPHPAPVAQLNPLLQESEIKKPIQ